METAEVYCVNCKTRRKVTGQIVPVISRKTKLSNGRLRFSGTCLTCRNKVSSFIKTQN